MLNQAILSKSNPQADVMYGLDNTFLSRALDADIFEPYRAKGLDNIPESLSEPLSMTWSPQLITVMCA